MRAFLCDKEGCHEDFAGWAAGACRPKQAMQGNRAAPSLRTSSSRRSIRTHPRSPRPRADPHPSATSLPRSSCCPSSSVLPRLASLRLCPWHSLRPVLAWLIPRCSTENHARSRSFRLCSLQIGQTVCCSHFESAICNPFLLCFDCTHCAFLLCLHCTHFFSILTARVSSLFALRSGWRGQAPPGRGCRPHSV